MTNGFNRQTGYKSCAFTGYRPQKMPFGFDEHDPRCVDFKKRLRDTIKELIGHGYVRVDENKLYWVKGDDTGSVDIWE